MPTLIEELDRLRAAASLRGVTKVEPATQPSIPPGDVAAEIPRLDADGSELGSSGKVVLTDFVTVWTRRLEDPVEVHFDAVASGGDMPTLEEIAYAIDAELFDTGGDFTGTWPLVNREGLAEADVTLENGKVEGVHITVFGEPGLPSHSGEERT